MTLAVHVVEAFLIAALAGFTIRLAIWSLSLDIYAAAWRGRFWQSVMRLATRRTRRAVDDLFALATKAEAHR